VKVEFLAQRLENIGDLSEKLLKPGSKKGQKTDNGTSSVNN
jgi:hypothetical protein